MRQTRTTKIAATRAARTTSVTFTAEELAQLARLLKAGQVFLDTRYSVVPKLKAAMTRLGVSTQGL